MQFTRRPSRRLSRRMDASQTDGGSNGLQDSNSEVVRSPVMLSSLANGSLKRHPDPKWVFLVELDTCSSVHENPGKCVCLLCVHWSSKKLHNFLFHVWKLQIRDDVLLLHYHTDVASAASKCCTNAILKW